MRYFIKYAHWGVIIAILGLAIAGKDVPLSLGFLALITPIMQLVEDFLGTRKMSDFTKERLLTLEVTTTALEQKMEALQSELEHLSLSNSLKGFE